MNDPKVVHTESTEDRERRRAINELLARLPAAAVDNFGEPEQFMLFASMKACGLTALPSVTGEPLGERCFGEMICERCGRDYYSHPMDWRVIGYGDVPFLNVLCDGRRVKL